MAIIEMASACGLPLIDSNRRNPMKTTTYGVGEMVADALKRGCREFIIGIGGSATNDAGIGMLKALGARFLDSGNDELEPVGENLIKVHQIDISQLNPALKESKFTIACDVSNPFFGEEGAAYVYAPQKGATMLQVIELDNGLRHYAQVIKEYTNMDNESPINAPIAVIEYYLVNCFMILTTCRTVLSMFSFVNSGCIASSSVTGKG